ncbi:hypothetical protein [Actinoplanes solisilvae]|uniref:hypothetical protein n=1 Tax=Actinoplanes solisilvae TaxID=2486853 RepID=UPI000FD8C92A|nr:hypothetical protein [Actinoplanes solisilvae]
MVDGGLLSDIHLGSTATINLSSAVFVGGRLQMQRIVLDGGTINFWDADFRGGSVELYAGDFRRGTIIFINSLFRGGVVSLGGVGYAEVDENKSLLHRTKISQAHVIFDNCTITSGEVGLYEADLEDGANIRFHRARLKGGASTLHRNAIQPRESYRLQRRGDLRLQARFRQRGSSATGCRPTERHSWGKFADRSQR